MTTIIADYNTLRMGADRLVNHSSLRTTSTKIKRVRIDSGCRESRFLTPGEYVLAGVSGRVDFANLLFDWVKMGMLEDKPVRCSTDEDVVNLIVLSQSGIYTSAANCLVCKVEDSSYYAVGSGMQVAMAALYLGCGIEKALQICHKFDFYTGDTYDILKL